MEVIIIIAIIIAIGYALYSQFGSKDPAVQQEVAKVEEVAKEAVAEVKAEVAAVKEVAKKTTTRAKKALDVNQDGKVNLKDAVDGVKAVKAKVTKAKAKPKAS
jgi:uncharacterized protein (UPF0333 family)